MIEVAIEAFSDPFVRKSFKRDFDWGIMEIDFNFFITLIEPSTIMIAINEFLIMMHTFIRMRVNLFKRDLQTLNFNTKLHRLNPKLEPYNSTCFYIEFANTKT